MHAGYYFSIIFRTYKRFSSLYSPEITIDSVVVYTYVRVCYSSYILYCFLLNGFFSRYNPDADHDSQTRGHEQRV